MTALDAATSSPSAASPDGPGPLRTALAVTAAGLVVAGTIAVIVVAGYVPLPPMPELAADPDPDLPGTIAFVHGSWEDACLATVAASGAEPVDLRCGEPVPQSLAWTIEGDLAVAGWDEFAREPDGATMTVLDAATGQELDRFAVTWETITWPTDRTERADGARLLASGMREGRAVLEVRDADGATRELLRVEGPRDYGIVSAQWSPDGEWVLAADTRGRLFVVAADGEPGPRLVADIGGRAAPWVLPAWWMEGLDGQAVDLATLEEQARP